MTDDKLIPIEERPTGTLWQARVGHRGDNRVLALEWSSREITRWTAKMAFSPAPRYGRRRSGERREQVAEVTADSVRLKGYGGTFHTSRRRALEAAIARFEQKRADHLDTVESMDALIAFGRDELEHLIAEDA